MSWINDARTTTILEHSRSSGLASAIAQSEAEAAASRARMAENQARALIQQNQDGNIQDRRLISSLRGQLDAKHEKLLETQIALQAAERAVQEKEALILEWMHSNDAFKMLAKQYGKKLGVSDEQRKEDYFEAVLDVAEQDPGLDNTRLKETAKKGLGRS